ncbi:glycosyltransferase family 4 protein [Ornithinimicrobium cerasi]|uniref:Glycosyltransferase involved in cell wall bisynthesis n=1 Tax=Ornithinimicrobium cerasi TaxID=2248773 RepID=A0A285VVA0_9MICO|nr:glycosyltransferase family 4 protein [Ornithinimicrobium cerasi]SOC57807.1 Glycosyltransferase involved in cell wall bisynthesis [Ornithinimicrobium cerasi]
MRVAITFHGCHRRGGVERVMYECANHLARQGHAVDALAGEWDNSPFEGGVQRHTLHYHARPPAAKLYTYARAARRAVGQLSPAPGVVAGFGGAAPPGSVTWMQSVHAAWMDISRQTRDLTGRARQRVNPFHPVALALERSLLGGRRYARVVALTPAVKADIMRYYDVPASDIEVIPNGYSDREFHVPSSELRASARRRLGFAEHDRVVIFVANELERKGFRPLVEGIRAHPDRSVKLLAVGGFNRAQARSIVDEAGLGDRVVLAGATNDVYGCYSAADCFALPTKYEAWGLVVVEAMASGLPALTSVSAGAAVAVEEGVNGTLVADPTSRDEVVAAVERLLTIRTDPTAISQSVAAYRWSTILQAYEDVLTGVST